MKFFICFLVLSLCALYAGHPAAKRLMYDRDWCYQPIIVNDEVVTKKEGLEYIQKRYEAVKQVLLKYKRPFKVLDIGANNGFFSLKIVKDFDAVCVLADGTERLTDICTLNTNTNRLIHLQKYFTINDIKELERREHFDVILALLVLHHVDNWMEWIKVLFKLGDNVIIEIPSENDPINQFENTKRLARYLTSLPNGIKIGAFHRGNNVYDHMLLFIHNSPSTKNRFGMLPSTFKELNGRFPSNRYVDEINRSKGTDKWILQGIDYSS